MSARPGGRDFGEALPKASGRQDGSGQGPLRRFHHADAADNGRRASHGGGRDLSARLFSSGKRAVGNTTTPLGGTGCQRPGWIRRTATTATLIARQSAWRHRTLVIEIKRGGAQERAPPPRTRL